CEPLIVDISNCRVGFSPPTNNRKIFWWAEAHPTLSTHHSMRASFYFRSNHYDDFIKAIQLLI
ncbi:hypothetical protein, partial [Haemophilus influenzae]|uniref:hypothetical protein n=1 Tax=Haemophilus influenzae TaxID=727 RepID=UPI001C615CF9